MDADVIVVGAGPAGSLAAFEMAVKGLKVLILEKAAFPRYKVCGAGLTHKILREIPFDISPVIQTSIHSFIFSRGFTESFRKFSPDPLIYCTMREDFDSFLLSRATGVGAKVEFGVHVTGILNKPGHVFVNTRKGEFTSLLLVGAEGAGGIVARSAGLWTGNLPGLAWEAEVRVDAGSIEKFRDTVFLDWGAFPGGYGWLFPKAGHFSIGVGGPASLAPRMKEYYREFTKYLAVGDLAGKRGRRSADSGGFGVEKPFPGGIRILETLSDRAWPIPVKSRPSLFHRGRVVVTGDAAGLTDPLTGEGICHAVMSGKAAAAECISFISGKCDSLAGYSSAVNSVLIPEIMEAYRIRNLFNAFPGRLHRLVKDHDRVWRAFCKVLRGDRRYSDVKSGFGKWKFLWSTVCGIAFIRSHHAEKRYSRKRSKV